MIDFSAALKSLKDGKKICRSGWNGKDMYLYLAESELPYPSLSQDRDWEEGSFPLSEYIVMKTADNKLVPWLASQTDLLAVDWLVITE